MDISKSEMVQYRYHYLWNGTVYNFTIDSTDLNYYLMIFVVNSHV